MANQFQSNLLLIGTVHSDPLGYERAVKLLQHFQPDLITVEVSHFSLRYRQRQEANWRRLLNQTLEDLPAKARNHLAIRRLMAQAALPFEARAARDYSRQYGIPWRPVDLGAISRRHLPRYARELMSPENLKTLLTTEDEPLEDFVAREYRRARLSCRRPAWRLPGVDPETRRRERLQVRRLRYYLARYDRLAHLGGWEHLAPWRDGDGMWQKLADYRPLRVLLDEADNEK
ncbi:MAG: hypothetical protein M1438_04205 [Deltaproteobacteria bacterium]|nr:hypothetical protein [Deltaproteobacteria bacterium]